MELGLLTERQYQILRCRGVGLSQVETANKFHTSRANVSMIELRAKKKIERAKQTIKAYESTLTNHLVVVPERTHLYDIPSFVLAEGDRHRIRIQANIIDIIRMVKGANAPCLSKGKTVRTIAFVFNQRGKLSLSDGISET